MFSFFFFFSPFALGCNFFWLLNILALAKRGESNTKWWTLNTFCPPDLQDYATMQFCANKLDKKDFFGKSDPFMVFYRSNEDGT